MPLAGQINSTTPKTTLSTPAASVQPQAFDPLLAGGERTGNLTDPQHVAQNATTNNSATL